MDGGAPSGGHRSSAVGSKDRLVDAAVELVHEHYSSRGDLRDVYSYLNPSVVADRAGLSRGLIYHHWPPGDDGVDAFSRFLEAVSVRLWSISSGYAEFGAQVEALEDASEANLVEIVRRVAEWELQRTAVRERAITRSTQMLAIQDAWPEGAFDLVIEASAASCRQFAEVLGVEPKPPLTYEDLAFAIACVLDGFSLYHGVSGRRTLRSYAWPSSAGDDDPQWSLLAIVLQGAIAHMVQPTGASD